MTTYPDLPMSLPVTEPGMTLKDKCIAYLKTFSEVLQNLREPEPTFETCPSDKISSLIAQEQSSQFFFQILLAFATLLLSKVFSLATLQCFHKVKTFCVQRCTKNQNPENTKTPELLELLDMVSDLSSDITTLKQVVNNLTTKLSSIQETTATSTKSVHRGIDELLLSSKQSFSNIQFQLHDLRMETPQYTPSESFSHMSSHNTLPSTKGYRAPPPPLSHASAAAFNRHDALRRSNALRNSTRGLPTYPPAAQGGYPNELDPFQEEYRV